MTSSKELLLIDTNFSKESLHEFINQFSKSFVDGFVIISVTVFTYEIYTVFFNERLDRCLPSCTLKEFVNCVENPVLKDRKEMVKKLVNLQKRNLRFLQYSYLIVKYKNLL